MYASAGIVRGKCVRICVGGVRCGYVNVRVHSMTLAIKTFISFNT